MVETKDTIILMENILRLNDGWITAGLPGSDRHHLQLFHWLPPGRLLLRQYVPYCKVHRPIVFLHVGAELGIFFQLEKLNTWFTFERSPSCLTVKLCERLFPCPNLAKAIKWFFRRRYLSSPSLFWSTYADISFSYHTYLYRYFIPSRSDFDVLLRNRLSEN